MHIVSHLGLLFRANVLNQLEAKVELAARHYSPARFTAALTGIDNRERTLAHRFSEGRLSLAQLQHQAKRLATQDVILNTPLRSAGGGSLPVERQPVETASAFRSVLVRAYCLSEGEMKQKLGELLAPETIRANARGMLADAVWKGHLHSSRELMNQVLIQAHREALDLDCSPDQLAGIKQERSREIVAFIGGRQPPGPDEAWHGIRAVLQAVNDALHYGTRAVPDSWTELSDTFWAGPGPSRTYESFSAAVARAVEEAVENEVEKADLAETRCRRTFELLEFIRQRDPARGFAGVSASRDLLDRHAHRLEGEAVDEMIGHRTAPAGSPDPGGSADASDA